MKFCVVCLNSPEDVPDDCQRRLARREFPYRIALDVNDVPLAITRQQADVAKKLKISPA